MSDVPTVESRSGRYRSLDGLRGLAALVVVAHHVVLADPHYGTVWFQPGQHDLNPVEYAAFYSPLHVFWAGTEAVIVFYVLSGFVLALPFARGRGAPWRLFYPRRLLRLYLPAIASLVLAWLLVLVAQRHLIGDSSPWMQQHALDPAGVSSVVLGSSLVTGFVGLNSSLWSLRWEVLFSMSLPLFVLFASRWPRALWWKIVLLVAVCALWPVSHLFYARGAYIVVFAFGVLMAYNVDRCAAWAARIPRAGWWLLVSTAVLLLTSTWVVTGVASTSRALDLWIASGALGATLLVFAAAWCAGVRRVLEWRWIRWLGAVSFSLYLVQEPIVVALAFVSGGHLAWWALLGPSVALSLLAAAVFYRFVEQPCHRIARSFGSTAASVGVSAPPRVTRPAG